MKKLNQKPGKGENQNPEADKVAPKREKSVVLTLIINGVTALAALVVVVFILNIALGIFTRHGSNRDVPELVGHTVEQAEQLLKSERLELIVGDTLFVPIYESGVVLEQRPSAGEDKVKAGRKIYVTINADHERVVKVPYVTGLSLRQAVGDIVAAGLEIDQLVFGNDLANKYVLDEKINGVSLEEDAEVSAHMGSGVTLVVGVNGSATEMVPNVVGKTLHEAKHILWSAGFNLGKVNYEGEMSLLEKTDAVIYKQSPAARTNANMGRGVALELTLDMSKLGK